MKCPSKSLLLFTKEEKPILKFIWKQKIYHIMKLILSTMSHAEITTKPDLNYTTKT
jgi:hypothetical protein